MHTACLIDIKMNIKLSSLILLDLAIVDDNFNNILPVITKVLNDRIQHVFVSYAPSVYSKFDLIVCDNY